MGGNEHSEILKSDEVKKEVIGLIEEYIEKKNNNPMYLHSLSLICQDDGTYRLSRYITV